MLASPVGLIRACCVVDLPHMLAGPLLRRVEPNLVSVWLALSKSATVKIRLWEGQVTPAASNVLTSGPDPAAQSIRIGDRLHIVVVTLKIKPGSGRELLPGRIYSYDLLLQTDQGSENLSSCRLLRHDPSPVVVVNKRRSSLSSND